MTAKEQVNNEGGVWPSFLPSIWRALLHTELGSTPLWLVTLAGHPGFLGQRWIPLSVNCLTLTTSCPLALELLVFQPSR